MFKIYSFEYNYKFAIQVIYEKRNKHYIINIMLSIHFLYILFNIFIYSLLLFIIICFILCSFSRNLINRTKSTATGYDVEWNPQISIVHTYNMIDRFPDLPLHVSVFVLIYLTLHCFVLGQCNFMFRLHLQHCYREHYEYT